MAKTKTIFYCTECGYESSGWLGKCPGCQNWNTFVEEKLKPEETKKFLENAFRDGVLKTTGTDVDKILPPVSRFGGGGSRDLKKQAVIEKLKAFFEKYFGLISPTDPLEDR